MTSAVWINTDNHQNRQTNKQTNGRGSLLRPLNILQPVSKAMLHLEISKRKKRLTAQTVSLGHEGHFHTTPINRDKRTCVLHLRSNFVLS